MCITTLARSQPSSLHSDGLQVYISKLARSWPPSASPYTLDSSLQVCLVMAFKCISKLARLRHASLHSPRLEVHISTIAWWWPPSWHDHDLHVHLQTPTITASKCISKIARLGPPSSHVHCLGVHLSVHSTTVWWDCGARTQIPHQPHFATSCIPYEENSGKRAVCSSCSQVPIISRTFIEDKIQPPIQFLILSENSTSYLGT